MSKEKIWVDEIEYEIVDNLGGDPSLNTYTNRPPTEGTDVEAD